MATDDDRPSNVIPFSREIYGAIGEELRKMYAAFLNEELPDSYAPYLQRLDELTRDK